jgi:Asp-tRNA(Asn)/Glu-tRNA(Gln) amidotransferase A subunit family amidase
MSELTLLPAVDLLAMVRSAKISPVELAEEFLREIERLNPRLNAIVDLDAERVRAQARAIGAAGAPLGPLSGLPMTAKSSIATAGHRCEMGSLLHRGNVPTEDAPVVARLRAAGAVLLGTTNCPEFLMAYETDNRLYGRTANPWDLERTPGGSSGGEAAAIAVGISAAGLGSDSGGSVRVPAHFTGICSLKPTPGRIPGRGHLPPCVGPFSFLGAIGPMARTVADVTLLFQTLSGADPLDPVAVPIPLRTPSLEEMKRIPIGFFEDDGLVPVSEETRQAVQDAVQALRRQGFQVRPFRPPSLERARQLWWTFFVGAGAMFLAPEVRGKEALLSPTFRDFLAIAQAGPVLTADALLQAWAECDLVRSKLLAEMQELPFLLCPVCSIPAFRHGERSWKVQGQPVEYLDAMRYTQWWNLLAAPAAVVPVGRSPEGLPIGVQVMGLPYADEGVLVLAAAIEREFGYQLPPLAKDG